MTPSAWPASLPRPGQQLLQASRQVPFLATLVTVVCVRCQGHQEQAEELKKQIANGRELQEQLQVQQASVLKLQREAVSV